MDTDRLLGHISATWLGNVQLATVKIHMCVVALTASIAACNITLVDDLSVVRHECDMSRSW